MRILVISNLYPPYFKGGDELICEETVEGLQKRGHDIRVLTSTYGITKPVIENNIYRFLSFRASPWQDWRGRLSFLHREIKEIRLLERLVKEERPHMLFIWGGVGLSKLLLLMAENLGIPAVYCIGGAWITKNWENDNWFRFWEDKTSKKWERIFKIFLKRCLIIFHGASGTFIENRKFALKYAFFNSHYTKNQHLEAGFSPDYSEVIYLGVSQKFLQGESRKSESGTIRLLYSGRLHSQKGVHTAIKAMAKLINESNIRGISLDIVGKDDLEYEEGLKKCVEKERIAEYINFCGQVPRSSMPGIYKQHDILIFPSIIEEGFGVVGIEAMACGLPVIGTATGGSKEFLKDGVNALVFPPDDPEALANQIRRLIEDESLRLRLAKAGQRLVQEKFSFEETIERMENLLKKVYQFECGGSSN